MLDRSSLGRGALLLAFALPLVACEDSGLGPDPRNINEPSRVLLHSDLGTSVSATLLSEAALARVPRDQKKGPIDLSTLDEINVQITGVHLAMAGADPDADAGWTELTVSDPEQFFNLKNLEELTNLATVPTTLSGEIQAVRLVFGDAHVIFKDDLDTPVSLRIPSGKVTIPAAGLSVNTEDENLVLTFEAETSVRKIIRTGQGLLMPPNFKVQNGDEDEEEGEGETGSDG